MTFVGPNVSPAGRAQLQRRQPSPSQRPAQEQQAAPSGARQALDGRSSLRQSGAPDAGDLGARIREQVAGALQARGAGSSVSSNRASHEAIRDQVMARLNGLSMPTRSETRRPAAQQQLPQQAPTTAPHAAPASNDAPPPPDTDSARRSGPGAVPGIRPNDDAVAQGARSGKVSSPVDGAVTATFRSKKYLEQFGREHNGVDFGAPVGTPIRSVKDGVVKTVGWTDANGNYTVIDHGDGSETWYLHQNSTHVKQGQRVRSGEQIGEVGNTGWSTGAHLHLEYRVDGKAVDPIPVLEEAGVQVTYTDGVWR